MKSMFPLCQILQTPLNPNLFLVPVWLPGWVKEANPLFSECLVPAKILCLAIHLQKDNAICIIIDVSKTFVFA